MTEELLAQRLRAAREARGLTQAEAATAIGVERLAIVQIENGKRKVSSMELMRLADAYGREMASFFRAHEDPWEAVIAELQEIWAEETPK